jgi:hypothetical protein
VASGLLRSTQIFCFVYPNELEHPARDSLNFL